MPLRDFFRPCATRALAARSGVRAWNRAGLGNRPKRQSGQKMGLRFRTLGWICIGLLLATGAINLAMRGISLSMLGVAAFWASDFGRTLAYKPSAVVVVVALKAAHDVLSTRAGARRLASSLGRATLLASLVVVLFACVARSGCLRLRPGAVHLRSALRSPNA